MSNGKGFPTHLFGASGGALKTPTLITNSFASSVKSYETDQGTHIIENLRIFKVGTFTDMFGQERTWDDVHLDQMVAHYHILKDGGYFPDVPVRADHTFSVKDVVGYYQDIYRDRDDPNFLSATIEITEDDAWQKWERRTWRSRSIEIGMYETNDGKLFHPVVMGLAFVDIGAVEGLHARQKQSDFQFHQVITDTEETSMGVPDITKDPEGWIKAANYAKALADWTTSANYAKALDDWTAAVNYAAALEAEHGEGEDGEEPPPGTPPANHNRPAPTASFRVNGQQTQDFRQVQAHIDTLEQFRSETTDANRQSFVEQLATDNKIAATQIDSLAAHALSLTDEQFSTFRATYESAPSLSVFGNQGRDGDNPPGTPPGTPPASSSDDELETAKEIVAQHRRAGMSEEKVQKTASFKKLVAAGITL